MSVKQFAALFAALASAVRAMAYTETIDGVEYSYTVADGKATIGSKTENAFLVGFDGDGRISFGGVEYQAAIAQTTAGDLIIPTMLGDCPVVGVGNWAFYNCGGITGVAIPDSVTHVVVHYVTAARESEAVSPPETTGIVNVIAEVRAEGRPVAVSSAWAEQYGEAFTAKFGNDFTKAVTMTSGKRDGAGNVMQVWQDFVAGTDPTNPDDVFTASITFDADGNPVISHSPELPAAEAAKRVYTTYGKVKLNDADWTPVPDGEESDYNFFKVTVEMR